MCTRTEHGGVSAACGVGDGTGGGDDADRGNNSSGADRRHDSDRGGDGPAVDDDASHARRDTLSAASRWRASSAAGDGDGGDGDEQRLVDRARHLLQRWNERRHELRLPGSGGDGDGKDVRAARDADPTSAASSILAQVRESLLTRPREELERIVAPYLSHRPFERMVLTRTGLARAARGIVIAGQDESGGERRPGETTCDAGGTRANAGTAHRHGERHAAAAAAAAVDADLSSHSLAHSSHYSSSRASSRSRSPTEPHHPLRAVALATRDRDAVHLPSFITALDDSISRQYIPASKAPAPPVPESYAPRDPGTGDTLANAVVIGAVGLAGKLIIGRLQNVHVYNVERLHEHVTNRPADTPLLTVSNHKSVYDDPFMLGAILPWRALRKPGDMRWGLCAADVCFRQPWYHRFFTLGKVMPIRRGGGLQQEELFAATRKLARGEWLHIYPEGKVSQRFLALMRHGVGKMVALASEWREGDAHDTPYPIVVPIYHEGMETVMPQDDETNALVSMVPRFRRDVYMMVGEPIAVADILTRYHSEPESMATTPDGADTVERVMMFEEICDRIALALAELRDELRARVKRDAGIDLREQLGAYD